MFPLFQSVASQVACHNFSSMMVSSLTTSPASSLWTCGCITSGPMDLCSFKCLWRSWIYSGWYFILLVHFAVKTDAKLLSISTYSMLLVSLFHSSGGTISFVFFYCSMFLKKPIFIFLLYLNKFFSVAKFNSRFAFSYLIPLPLHPCTPGSDPCNLPRTCISASTVYAFHYSILVLLWGLDLSQFISYPPCPTFCISSLRTFVP